MISEQNEKIGGSPDGLVRHINFEYSFKETPNAFYNEDNRRMRPRLD
jgi:hypothetical protein